MDVKYPIMVVGLAEKKILVYDLNNAATMRATSRNSRENLIQPIFTGESALKLQTRCISIFPDKGGYAVGSIEGRCSIVYFQDTTKNFAFKCHRTQEEIFAVNAISFHPTFGTFATAGSDGVFTFWDKDNRQRLKLFNTCHYPITATKFNDQGNLFAYACSYDWSKILNLLEKKN